MLEIRVEIEKQLAKDFFESQGSHCDISDKLVMCAYDGGTLVGAGAVSMTSQETSIEEICCPEGLELALGKALLNTLDLGGIKKVHCRQPRLFALAKRLGFKSSLDDSCMELSLDGYFTGGCH